MIHSVVAAAAASVGTAAFAAVSPAAAQSAAAAQDSCPREGGTTLGSQHAPSSFSAA